MATAGRRTHSPSEPLLCELWELRCAMCVEMNENEPIAAQSDGLLHTPGGEVGEVGAVVSGRGVAPGLISPLKPLIVMLYHLDNYRCSKITAQQTVKLYLW